MVPGGSLDHQVLCFPTNLKGSVPRVPDANLVQLFKSSLGQAFQHQSLESLWRSLEDPWRARGARHAGIASKSGGVASRGT